MSKDTWKPVSVPSFSVESGEFHGLIHIEELTDYGDICTTTQRSNKKWDKPKKKSGLSKTLDKKKREKNLPKKLKKRGLGSKEKQTEHNVTADKPQQPAITKNSAGNLEENDKQKSKKRKKRRKEKIIAKRRKIDVEKATHNNNSGSDKNIVENQSEELATEGSETLDVNVKDGNASNWLPFNIAPEVLRAILGKNFIKPTEIQALCIPEAMFKKKDVFGAAETGSGKTLAFGIPIVCGILEEMERANQNIYESNEEANDELKNERLWALVIAPTRELVIQVKNHITDICKYTDIKVLELVGGLAVEKQDRLLKKHPHIVVGTPGRLWQLIRSGNEYLSSQIDSIRYLVIDEADRMVERLHFPELLCLLERLNYKQHKFRQTFMFSATLTLVHELPKYVKNRFKNRRKPVKMTSEEKLESFSALVGAKNPSVIDVTKQNVVTGGLKELRIECTLEEKDVYLYYLIKVHKGRKIIFCNSINCVKRLNILMNLLQIRHQALFAGMAQKQRLKNFERFQKNENGVLIATDVASRGLDVPDVEFIIHYHVPKVTELYVHRSGRSARGNKEGTTILLCSPSETNHYNKILRTLEKGDVQSYKIESPHVLNAVKQSVLLARDILELQNKLQKITSNCSWVEKCAREMEIELDEDEMPKKLNPEEHKYYNARVKSMMKQLKKLLEKPILPYGISPKYPTYNMESLCKR